MPLTRTDFTNPVAVDYGFSLGASSVPLWALSGTSLVVTETANADTVILYATPRLTTANTWKAKSRIKLTADAATGQPHALGIYKNSTNSPVADTQTTFNANHVFRIALDNTQDKATIAYKQVTSGTWTYWGSGGSWGTGNSYQQDYTRGTWVTAEIESNGTQVRGAIYDANDSLIAQSGWVNWTDTYAPANPVFAYLGDPYNNIHYAVFEVDWMEVNVTAGSIYYVDPVSGVDSTGRGQAATPYQKLGYVCTDRVLYGGDEVRFAKSTSHSADITYNTGAGTARFGFTRNSTTVNVYEQDGTTPLNVSSLDTALAQADCLLKSDGFPWMIESVGSQSFTLKYAYSWTTEVVTAKKLGVIDIGSHTGTTTGAYLYWSEANVLKTLPVRVSGGWDLTNTTQDGATWIQQKNPSAKTTWQGTGLYTGASGLYITGGLHIIGFIQDIDLTEGGRIDDMTFGWSTNGTLSTNAAITLASTYEFYRPKIVGCATQGLYMNHMGSYAEDPDIRSCGNSYPLWVSGEYRSGGIRVVRPKIRSVNSAASPITFQSISFSEITDVDIACILADGIQVTNITHLYSSKISFDSIELVASGSNPNQYLVYASQVCRDVEVDFTGSSFTSDSVNTHVFRAAAIECASITLRNPPTLGSGGKVITNGAYYPSTQIVVVNSADALLTDRTKWDRLLTANPQYTAQSSRIRQHYPQITVIGRVGDANARYYGYQPYVLWRDAAAPSGVGLTISQSNQLHQGSALSLPWPLSSKLHHEIRLFDVPCRSGQAVTFGFKLKAGTSWGYLPFDLFWFIHNEEKNRTTYRPTTGWTDQTCVLSSGNVPDGFGVALFIALPLPWVANFDANYDLMFDYLSITE